MAIKAEGLVLMGGMATAACTVAADMVVLLAAGDFSRFWPKSKHEILLNT